MLGIYSHWRMLGRFCDINYPVELSQQTTVQRSKMSLREDIAPDHVAGKSWSLNSNLDLLTLESIFLPRCSSASKFFWPSGLCHVAPSIFLIPGPVIPPHLLCDKPSRATYLTYTLCFCASVLMIFGVPLMPFSFSSS